MRTYELTTSKIKKDITFGIITDIHYQKNYNINILYNLMNKYVKTKPDYILVLGDILNYTNMEEKELEPLINFFKDLSKHFKTYIILGNHDKKAKLNKKVIAQENKYFYTKLKSLNNTTILENSIISLNQDINLIGLEFSHDYYINEEKQEYEKLLTENLPKIDKSKYNILLIHTPLNANSKKLTNIDLILSGHEHNGCIPSYLDFLPTNRGLVGTKGNKLVFFSNYTRGLKKLNDKSTCIIFRPIITFSDPKLHWLNLFYPITEQYVRIKSTIF